MLPFRDLVESPIEPMAVVIQACVKADTLEACCQSLLQVHGRSSINLIFWFDSAIGSKREDHYARLSRATRNFLNDFAFNHASSFRSIQVRRNDRNLGTCKTCQIALDFAFATHPFVVFAEDDVIFTRDAMLWFDDIRRLGLLDNEEVWAIAGESIFFNARDGKVTQELVTGAKTAAHKEGLLNKYTRHSFIPSTCFATTREKWAVFGTTRGQPLGDVDICNRCTQEHKVAIFPIVPRVRDIGMLHEEGYSVMIHGRDGVREVKQTYLTADSLVDEGLPEKLSLEPFEGNAGLLYRRSTLLEGFCDA